MASATKTTSTARILTNHEWGAVFSNICERGRGTLASEAERLHLEKKELVRQGDKKYPNNRKWKNLKILSEKREKKMQLKPNIQEKRDIEEDNKYKRKEEGTV